MKKTTRLKIGILLGMGISVLAGCSAEEAKPEAFMSNEVTPDDLKAKETKKSKGAETVEGWAYTGDEFFQDSDGYRYAMGGFQDENTLVINVLRFDRSTYSMYYKISPGMNLPIGSKEAVITLLEANSETSKMKIRIEPVVE